MNKPQNYTVASGWYVVKKGKTMDGDMVLAPSNSGRGRRWHRCWCVGLPVENAGGLIYRRQLSAKPSLAGWFRNLYFRFISP